MIVNGPLYVRLSLMSSINKLVYLTAGSVPILQALLNDIGGKLVLTQPHNLARQLLYDFLPAQYTSALNTASKLTH